MRRLLLAALTVLFGVAGLQAHDLLEPQLRLPASSGAPRIAVTLDACMGGIDYRILDVLVEERIPATLFVTDRWMRNNGPAVAVLAAHQDLFAIEDHGRNHVPAVTGTEKPYGITPAGTLAAVEDEVLGGGAAILAGFGRQPTWFRGATALYTPDAVELIGKLGYRIAGFSLNADFGASASAAIARARLEGAVDGDVVIAHVNQPGRPAGEGIAQGLLNLKRNGYEFIRLDQVQ